MSSSSSTPPAGRPVFVAGVLGFALGGFFDGILLHQVLQWHHFLSLVPGEALRDIRAQILADGLFHVAVYAVAALGLWLLWRARGGLAAADGLRRRLGLEGAFAAVTAADGRVVRAADASGKLLVVELGSDSGAAWRLHRHGALLVGTSGPAAGCLVWTKA